MSMIAKGVEASKAESTTIVVVVVVVVIFPFKPMNYDRA